jgi:hypothetical protein
MFMHLVVVVVVAQQGGLAPQACFRDGMVKPAYVATRQLLNAESRLSPIAFSKRKDLIDREVAAEIMNYTAALSAELSHTSDLIDIGATASEKKTRQLVRSRLFLNLKMVKNRVDQLREVLRRNGEYVTLPVLANEVRELETIVSTFTDDFDDCIGETAVP